MNSSSALIMRATSIGPVATDWLFEPYFWLRFATAPATVDRSILLFTFAAGLSTKNVPSNIFKDVFVIPSRLVLGKMNVEVDVYPCTWRAGGPALSASWLSPWHLRLCRIDLGRGKVGVVTCRLKGLNLIRDCFLASSRMDIKVV